MNGEPRLPRRCCRRNGLALLLFGLLPQPLMALCFVAIKAL